MEATDNQSSHNLNLNAYFKNKRIRRHLIKAGLISRRGDIIPPPSFEVALGPRVKRKEAKEKLALAITNYVLDEERRRQAFIHKQIDLVTKRSRVQKIQETRHYPQHIRSLSHSVFQITKPSRSKHPQTPSPSRRRSPIRPVTALHPPVNVTYKLIHRSLPPQKTSNPDHCEVTMVYYGPQIVKEYNHSWDQPHADELVVMQQHCGGENLVVFKGFVKPNDTFTFQSRRHFDFPFALSLYINGRMDSRISVCCEYKHKLNVRLGSKQGLFGVCDVQKGKPCAKCQYARRNKKQLLTATIETNQSTNRTILVRHSSYTTEFRPERLLQTPSPSPISKSIVDKQTSRPDSAVPAATRSSPLVQNTDSTASLEEKSTISEKASRVSSASSGIKRPSQPVLVRETSSSHTSSRRSSTSTSSIAVPEKSLTTDRFLQSSSSSTSKSSATLPKAEGFDDFYSSQSSRKSTEKDEDLSMLDFFADKEKTEEVPSDRFPTTNKLSRRSPSILSDASSVKESINQEENGIRMESRSSIDKQEAVEDPPSSTTDTDEEMLVPHSRRIRHARGEEFSTAKSKAKPMRQYRSVENLVVVWLDATVNDTNTNTASIKSQLRLVARTLQTFSEPTKCSQFIETVKNENIFLVVSGRLSELILQQMENYPQVVVVYIFCEQKSTYEHLTKQYQIVKGIYTEIESVCEHLKIDSKQWDNDLNTFQSIPSLDHRSLTSLDRYFILNQLFKEYLLEMQYDRHLVEDLIEYCRQFYAENPEELQVIKEFESDYRPRDALLWYTKDSFAYYMLNRAIRMKDMTILPQMGAFLRDVNDQLEQIHANTERRTSTLTVFRGQGMNLEYFEELKSNENGLISFQGFLSTSVERTVAYKFAQQSLTNGFPIAVLFRIRIAPNNTLNPYASLEHLSSSPKEYEILFSLKTIFQIQSMEQLEDHLWQVDLSSIDEKQHDIIRHIQNERQQLHHLVEVERMAKLLIEMNEFEQAKNLYEYNLPDITDPKYTYVCTQIASISTRLDNDRQALEFYNHALRTKSQESLDDHVTISKIHNQIGQILYRQNKVREALNKFQQALSIQLEYLSATHPSLLDTYDHLARVSEEYDDDYQTALEYREKQLEIANNVSVTNQTDLALIHLKIGLCLENLDRLDEAVTHVQQSIDLSPMDDGELQDRQTILERIREQIE